MPEGGKLRLFSAVRNFLGPAGRGATVVKKEASNKNPTRSYNMIMTRETALYTKGGVDHPLCQRADWA